MPLLCRKGKKQQEENNWSIESKLRQFLMACNLPRKKTRVLCFTWVCEFLKDVIDMRF